MQGRLHIVILYANQIVYNVSNFILFDENYLFALQSNLTFHSQTYPLFSANSVFRLN